MNNLEFQLQEFGKEIFKEISNVKNPIISKKYWIQKGMGLSMKYPNLKKDLFRLVDVFPALKTSQKKSQTVIKHAELFLGSSLKEINPIFYYLLRCSNSVLIRNAVSKLIESNITMMANQYIVGEEPKTAFNNLRQLTKDGFLYTVDLLGEFCLCEKDAENYKNRYLDCLSLLDKDFKNLSSSKTESSVCISVKLTALYSQCSGINFKKSVKIISERLSVIVAKAKELNAQVYIDAEDAENNYIIYEVFKQVFSSEEFRDFPTPGIVVQVYFKEAEKIINDLIKITDKRSSKIAIRLVKGAYWDHETTLCQQNNWENPLFAEKHESDKNFEYLTKHLMNNNSQVFAAIASHNIRSLSHACCYAQNIGLRKEDYELQMLYGMAEPIAHAFKKKDYSIRYYCPIGDLIVGMGYLVRRLLENTSNESFLRHVFFDEKNIEELLITPTKS